MYEYAPKPKKMKEKLLLTALLFTAAVLFAGSLFPNAAFPGLLQMLAVCVLVASVLITVRCLMKRYICRVEAPEQPDALPDFTVTETDGKHITVVCRLSVGQIRTAVCLTGRTRREIADLKRGKHCFNYTGMLFPEGVWLLTAEEGEETLCVLIPADTELIRILTSH